MHCYGLIVLLKDGALAALKARLAEEDLAKRKAGTTFVHRMTPSMFVQQALEIEDAQ
jgi:hypothetical protein